MVAMAARQKRVPFKRFVCLGFVASAWLVALQTGQSIAYATLGGSLCRGPPTRLRHRFGQVPPARTATLAGLGDVAARSTEVDPVTAELDVSSVPDVMGVYAIYDGDNSLQYIGLSKKIRTSVQAHAKALGPQEAGALIASVKFLEMPGQSKDALKQTWEKWIQDHMDAGGDIPAGNLPDNAPGADPRWRSRSRPAQPSLKLAGMGEPLEAVASVVQNNPVVLFMKGTPALPQCGFSAKTVGILREVGVSYESVNVLDADANPGVRDAVKEFANWPTIPQLYINGELVGGADIVSDLFERGELQARVASVREGASQSEHRSVDPNRDAADSVPKVDIHSINDPKRPTATAISQTLEQQFDLYALKIVDESAFHEGDAGALEMGLSGESHFKVEIVASNFEGLSQVQRQQTVFTALGEIMPKIHALSLVTRTPAEMQSR